MLRLRRARALAVGVALSTAMATVGCGSSSSSSSSQGSTNAAATTGASSPAVSAAKGALARYLKPQPPISVPALPKRPPAGLRLSVITCNIPVCLTESDAVVAGAKLLGWKVNVVQFNLTPEAYQAAWTQVVQSAPQLLSAIAIFPDAVVKQQILALEAKHVPYVGISPNTLDVPSAHGPMQAAVVGAPQYEQAGSLMGDAVVADADGAAKTAFIWDPANSGLWSPIKDSFSKVVSGAGGSVDVVDVSEQNIGKTIPGQIVSYVQSHPSVKYLAFALSDLDAGVPQALQAAGLAGNVKIVSRAPQASNLAALKSGAEWVEIGEENTAGGYRSVDQLARIVEHVPLGGLRNPAGWAQIFTKNNVPQTATAPVTPGTPAAFERAWHLN
jgi:ribose transport system substrate-binding protein